MEVPGETVVVEKEVVKTVEVPGQTVVVEKEVVKTVEVPGPERIVVKEVAGKKYVTDPTTGKPVTAPEYGGTITFRSAETEPVDRRLDAHDWRLVVIALYIASGVLEKLSIGGLGNR